MVAVLGALVALAVSCGDERDAVAAADRATTTTAPGVRPAPTSTTTPAASAAAVVGTATTELGTVLVDGAGRTLYLFTPDHTGSPTCVDQCAAAWPPLRTDGAPVAGAGVDSSRLGTVDRPDGTRQVTSGGHPLYAFAGDSGPGQVNGQGSGGTWFAVGPNGTAVRTASGAGPAY